MLYHRGSVAAAAVLLAFTTTAAAQECNPLEDSCKPLPAIGQKVDCDLTEGECTDLPTLGGTQITYNASTGAVLQLKSEKDEPTFWMTKYLFYGRIELEMQGAPGVGIVTSAVLSNGAGDEINFIVAGGDEDEAQTNYVFQGVMAKNAGSQESVEKPTKQYHVYSIDWTSTAINWAIDGKNVRTQLASDTIDNAYPHLPLQLSFRTWVAGKKSNPDETITWAGGLADWDDGPFTGYLRSATITDYAGGNAASKDVIKEYSFTNKNGTAASVKITKDGDEEEDDTTTTTSAPEDSSTTTTDAADAGATSGTAVTSGAADASATNDGNAPASSAPSDEDSESDSGVSPGAIAGIVIGIIALVALGAAAGWFCHRRRRSHPNGAAELGSNSMSELADGTPAQKSPTAFVNEPVPAYDNAMAASAPAAELGHQTYQRDEKPQNPNAYANANYNYAGAYQDASPQQGGVWRARSNRSELPTGDEQEVSPGAWRGSPGAPPPVELDSNPHWNRREDISPVSDGGTYQTLR